MARRAFGALRNLETTKGKPARWQAKYRCPDADEHPAGAGVWHTAHSLTTGKPTGTFSTKGRKGEPGAEGWLSDVQAAINSGRHVCPIHQQSRAEAARDAQQTFRTYAEHWLVTRRKSDGSPLAERTKLLYRRQLDELLSTFGGLPLEGITAPLVRTWWKVTLPADHPDRQTGNAHVYALLRTILGTAVEDELIGANPCTIKGAGITRRRKTIRPATVAEVEAIAADLPARYELMVLIAGWCALRFGEVAELRRRDVAKDGSVLHIQRGMTYEAKHYWVGEPKADSKGDVAVPPHLRPALLDHIRDHAQPGRDGLLFWRPYGYSGRCGCGYAACAGGHIFSQWFDRYYRPATEAAGRPELTFHELRHTGNVLAAEAGASLADQMKRMRHRTVGAALRYQHAIDGRDAELAERMSQMLEPKQTKRAAKRTATS